MWDSDTSHLQTSKTLGYLPTEYKQKQKCIILSIIKLMLKVRILTFSPATKREHQDIFTLNSSTKACHSESENYCNVKSTCWNNQWCKNNVSTPNLLKVHKARVQWIHLSRTLDACWCCKTFLWHFPMFSAWNFNLMHLMLFFVVVL